MIHNCVLILQNCMDSLKVEPGSCSETYATSSYVENRIIGIKVEEGSNVEEEEEDPLLIPFTPLKSECEVSVACVVHRGYMYVCIYIYPGLCSIFPHLHLCPNENSPAMVNGFWEFLP